MCFISTKLMEFFIICFSNARILIAYMMKINRAFTQDTMHHFLQHGAIVRWKNLRNLRYLF